MDQEAAIEAAWKQIIAAQSAEFGWGLQPADVQQYATALRHCLPASADEATVRRTCAYYHQDHSTVAVLASQGYSGHHETWRAWVQLALRTLQQAGLTPLNGRATTVDDLVQAVLVQLAGALPRFRYQSRLTTWAHTVVVQAARRRAAEGP